VHQVRWLTGLILIVVVFSATSGWGASLESTEFPSLVSTLRAIGPVDFCGEVVPLETQEIRERLEKELLLSLWNRSQVILWLKRSSRYLPYIEKMLKQSEMPDDLKYVAIVESALRPRAQSRKGAVGFWQFVKGTGRKYGLVINEGIDERLNLFASTQAALRYLQDLYAILGSWTLAVAAYNMGEEGLIAETIEQETKDYYQLYLPYETQRYVSRILSAKLIFANREKFGFRLKEEDYYPPVEFEKVKIHCLQDVPVRIVGQAARTNFKVIKDLNPQIRGYYLLSGSHMILVPKGASAGFRPRYRQLLNKFLAAKEKRIYVVKKGDNLTSIAGKFDVPLTALIIWNRIDLKQPIQPGDRLFIYPDRIREELEPSVGTSVEVDRVDEDSLQVEP
jgi:membrane-bound lytic murein transglycosylase D